MGAHHHGALDALELDWSALGSDTAPRMVGYELGMDVH